MQKQTNQMANSGELQTQIQPKLFARAEIYRILTKVLIEKKPLPPNHWSVVKFDREAMQAGKEYDLDLFSRHWDALTTSVFYLVDFARQMPGRVNLSTTNERVREFCGELADEIEQITYEPEAVIAKHGKLKAWLKAKLAVQTCFIYREETERVRVEKEEARRLERRQRNTKSQKPESISQSAKGPSNLAQMILNKISGKSMPEAVEKSEQPSLF